MHLNPLISDLALILFLAGVTTLIFKFLKQPVVLGYIVAGFLASPQLTFVPSVQEVASIHIWAEIGIIFLLFALGLEFSFKKLLHVGGSSVISSFFIVIGMMLMGFLTGRLLGWSLMDAIFLGAMLCMSSTTIIIKAFDDLGLKNQKFATTVFGVLIVEDLFAILLMVILSSMAISKQFDSGFISESIFKLIFFLTIWFLIGLYLIPIFLKRIKRFLNAETLLVISIGLCLSMVVVANYVGFSSALGAFIMGSILAETVEAERIEKLIKPVKDLFGAVFFVSVGMLVDISELSHYILPIIIITIVVIFGQIFFGGAGVLISGQPLKVAIQSGFSLAQIGEFAFIIASLGISLKVTSSFLYPIVVAVAVITTFTTPFIIKMADPAHRFIEKRMPVRWRLFIDRFSAGKNTVNRKSDWNTMLKATNQHMILHSIILSGIIWISFKFAAPFFIERWGFDIGRIITSVITISVMAPILWSMAFKRTVSKELFRTMWIDTRYNHGPIIAIGLSRMVASAVFAMVVFVHFFSYRWGTLVGFVVLCFVAFLFSKQIRRTISHLEKTLIRNLNAREDARAPKINNLIHDVHIADFVVSPDSELIGRYLYKADFRNQYGVSIVSIHRGNRYINIPGPRDQLMPFDKIRVVGNDEQIKKFGPLIESVNAVKPSANESSGVIMRSLTIDEHSFYVGKTLKESDLQGAQCLIITIERRNRTFVTPTAEVILQPGDLVSLVGQKDKLESVIQGFCAID
ncbi:MAG: cation:proton antiporter [Bacteroidales bacterium]|nr:cation:proton antiporter [Bacteroidales bacterium]